jgi:hypothetical protein
LLRWIARENLTTAYDEVFVLRLAAGKEYSGANVLGEEASRAIVEILVRNGAIDMAVKYPELKNPWSDLSEAFEKKLHKVAVEMGKEPGMKLIIVIEDGHMCAQDGHNEYMRAIKHPHRANDMLETGQILRYCSSPCISNDSFILRQGLFWVRFKCRIRVYYRRLWHNNEFPLQS